MEKAYKLLSQKHHISHNKAKELIDSGLVSANGRKLTLARALLEPSAQFSIQHVAPIAILHESDDLLVVNKPAFIESYALERQVQSGALTGKGAGAGKDGGKSAGKSSNKARFADYELLHRLDRETSGVLLLAKRESHISREVLRAFKQREVRKIYYALVGGIIAEPRTISAPILTKKGASAKSKVHKDGLSATTHITPESIVGKKTLLRVEIETGRTHQIRVHLAHIGHPVLGDSLYGGGNAKRLMLHASDIALPIAPFGLDFHAPLPEEFCIR